MNRSPPVEGDASLEAVCPGRSVPLGEQGQPGAHLRLEHLGVQPDPVRIEHVAAPPGGDEPRLRPAGPLRLEPLPEHVHLVADAVPGHGPGLGPQRVRDLVARHHAVALADQVLEQLTGSLVEPFASHVEAVVLDPGPAERLDSERRRLDRRLGEGRAPPIAVAGVIRAQVEDDARLGHVDGRRGHPDARVAVSAQLYAHLGQRLPGAHRPAREAPGLAGTGTVSVEGAAYELATGQLSRADPPLIRGEQRRGTVVDAQHAAVSVGENEAER